MDGRIDLRRARREAKALLKAARAGDVDAQRRIGRAEPRLADAQLAIARERGERSWPRLVARAEAEAVERAERHRRFVEWATTGRRDRADALLDVEPDLPRRQLDAALVRGEADVVAAALRRDPAMAARPAGVREWPPLVYVTHSAYLGGERTGALLACATALLDAGASPDSTWRHPEFGDLSALYGAAGVAHEPRMTKLLLDAGANPDDGESVYHATETGDPTCLRLLLDAGARVEGTNALAHCLDREDPEMLRLLLDHEPGHELGGSLFWAIGRQRSVEVVRMLVEAGDDPNRRLGLDTPYGLARRYGRHELAEALVEMGARREATPADEVLGVIARGERDQLERLLEAHPDVLGRLRGELAEVLVSDAADGRRAGVELLLELGVPVATRGQLGGTALHHAAWWGEADIVAVLLQAGADPHLPGGADAPGTPLAWAAHGSREAPRRPDADHVRIAELLVAAGARVEPAMADQAAGETEEWLRDQVDDGPAAAVDLRTRERGHYGERSCAAAVAYLDLLPGERRALGDGFVVRTGVRSNAENGVSCDTATADEIEAALAWLTGAPATWHLGPDSALGAALIAAGCRPERRAVTTGAPVDEAVLDRPGAGVDVEIAGTEDLARWVAVGEGAIYDDLDTAERERRVALESAIAGRLPHLVATRGGRPVGIASFMVHGDTLLVRDLAVVPAERRRGVGRALVAACVDRARGCAHVLADPTPGSIGFFNRLGLRAVPIPADRVFYLPVDSP